MNKLSPKYRPCIIAFEGMSGTGKSTLAKEIAENLGWPRIGESFNFFKPGETVPQIDSYNSPRSCESNHNFLLKLEMRKNAEIYNLFHSETPPPGIIMERTPLTLLYTERAIQKLKHLGNYPSLLQQINKRITQGKIILPDYIFWIMTPAKIAKQRIESRQGTTAEFFTQLSTLEKLRKEENRLIQQHHKDICRGIPSEVIRNNRGTNVDVLIQTITQRIRTLFE